ncbi:hypothetical protein N7467_012332, partial [Penicillium canescens]
IEQPLYISPINTEPLYRYQKGGYYLVALGEFLKSRREVTRRFRRREIKGYTKLYNSRDKAYIAIKISVIEEDYNRETREL